MVVVKIGLRLSGKERTGFNLLYRVRCSRCARYAVVKETGLALEGCCAAIAPPPTSQRNA